MSLACSLTGSADGGSNSNALFDIIHGVPRAQASHLFAVALAATRRPLCKPCVHVGRVAMPRLAHDDPAPHLAAAAAQLAVSIDNYRLFKAFLADLCDVACGRESESILDSYRAKMME